MGYGGVVSSTTTGAGWQPVANTPAPGRYVDANGVRVHYLDAGEGTPLVLLHGGSASNHPVWDASGWGWNAHAAQLARHHRVLAPDMRGHGWTRNPGGAVSYDLLATDLHAFLDALDIVRPLIIGFSDGGVLATVLAIREPDVLGALVNIAGYDLFDPDAPSMTLLRRFLGGSADASEPALDRLEAAGGADHEARLISHDGAQGPGTWRTMFADAFQRWTAPIGYDLDDLERVRTPTLILAGDRDVFCSPEESVRAYRRITDSELAIIPNERHAISAAMIPISLEFLGRRARSTQG